MLQSCWHRTDHPWAHGTGPCGRSSHHRRWSQRQGRQAPCTARGPGRPCGRREAPWRHRLGDSPSPPGSRRRVTGPGDSGRLPAVGPSQMDQASVPPSRVVCLHKDLLRVMGHLTPPPKQGVPRRFLRPQVLHQRLAQQDQHRIPTDVAHHLLLATPVEGGPDALLLDRGLRQSANGLNDPVDPGIVGALD